MFQESSQTTKIFLIKNCKSIRGNSKMTNHNVARVPISGGGPLISPHEQDDGAIIHPAEDFTVSITTISGQLYTKYKRHYLAGEHNNNYFVLLSKVGLGNIEQPIAKVHFLEHIDRIDANIRDIWAENVETVEDYQAGGKERLYLSFLSFCQDLGNSPLEDIKNSLQEISRLTGSIFPALATYTTSANVVVEGINNILKKIIEPRLRGEIKQVTFNLYPASLDSDPANGDAPLQTGSYVLFFEDTDIDNLRLEKDGTVSSSTNEEISPYIVVNIKRDVTLAPEQIEASLANEVLENFAQSYGYPLPKEAPRGKYFEALKEVGKSIRLAKDSARYFELKAKKAPTSAESQRLKNLGDFLKKALPGFESEII